MTTVFVTETSEVAPDRKCRCDDAAELHEVVKERLLRARNQLPYDVVEYYDKCTVQGCQCLCFEEAEL